MILERLGFVGWEKCEPIILAALVIKHPILLIGSHGCNKTDGTELITRALLGPSARFQKYDLQHLSRDDLMGYASPFSLKEGEVKHIPTPISIWGATSVLLDELNRVNPMISSKALELVRSRKVMGLPTGVEYVFASLNPPGRYNTSHLDLPLAARFAIVKVPSIENLKNSIETILEVSEPSPEAAEEFRALVETARRVQFASSEVKKVNRIIAKVVRVLVGGDPQVRVEPREARSMRDLLLACEKLNRAFAQLTGKNTPLFTTDAKVSVLASKIPEISKVCRAQVGDGVVLSQIRETLTGFALEDPLVIASNVLELIETRDPDESYWAASVVRALEAETRPELLLPCLSRLHDLVSLRTINEDTYNALVHSALSQLFLVDERLLAEHSPFTWDRSGMRALLRRVGQRRSVKDRELDPDLDLDEPT